MTQILECVSEGGSTRTKIMFKAFLSYAQAKEYMAFLQEKGLVEYEEGTSLYRITERGFDFLRKWDDIRAMVSVGETNSQPKAFL
jgi:predicted transcriptional regulator